MKKAIVIGMAVVASIVINGVLSAVHQNELINMYERCYAIKDENKAETCISNGSITLKILGTVLSKEGSIFDLYYMDGNG